MGSTTTSGTRKSIRTFRGAIPERRASRTARAVLLDLERGAVRAARAKPRSLHQRRFLALKHHLNDNPDCHLELRFDGNLAHLVYAGADMLVMPSNYEPGGLIQMIALKYGAVPIASAVGGLADTVIDRDYSGRPPRGKKWLRLRSAGVSRGRVGPASGVRALVRVPRRVPQADGERDATRLLVESSGPPLPEYLRPYSPQMTAIDPTNVSSLD